MLKVAVKTGKKVHGDKTKDADLESAHWLRMKWYTQKMWEG